MLVTSGTVTSADMMQAAPARRRASINMCRWTRPRAVARFLDHWRPDAGLFVESDLWPNLLLEAQRRGVKLALVNARISERSAARLAARAADGAQRCSAPSTSCWRRTRISPTRFRALGARDVDGGGQPEGRRAAAGLRRGRAGRDAAGDRRTRPCCWRPRPIPAKTRPCCPPTTCCGRDFPIFSPSSCRAMSSAAPISPCCAAAAPAHAARRASRITRRDRDLYRRHHGRAGAVLSPVAFLLSGRHPGADAAGTIRWSRRSCNCAILAGPSRANSAPTAYRSGVGRTGLWRRPHIAATLRARPSGCSPIREAPARRARRRRGARQRLSGAVEKTIAALKSLLPMRAPEFWQRRGPAATLLAPLGVLYGASVAWKARHARPYRATARVDLRRQSHRGRQRQDAGGARHRARACRRAGPQSSFSPAAMAAATRGRLQVQQAHTRRAMGDEALLLARCAPTIVARDRAQGAAWRPRKAPTVHRDG